MDNLKDLIVELYKLNPDGIFMIDDLTGDHNTLFSSIPIEDLKLPEGFYYNEKNGITNKHNTEDGHYVSFKVNAITREELEKMEVENKDSKEDIENSEEEEDSKEDVENSEEEDEDTKEDSENSEEDEVKPSGIVQIQFPKDENKPYWDGLVHDITPKELVCLNNSEFYALYGYDNSFKFSMLTLLEKKEDKFFKVPLDDYRKFIELLKKTDLIDASIDELNSKIELAPSMTVKDLEDRLKGKTNEVPKNPTVQRPNKVDNSRIFTDESRIDAKHSYLTVSNAKNLGYLGGIDNNKVKPAKSENKDTYNIFEEEIKNIDMPDQDKIIPLRRIMENKPSIFKRMTNKVGEIKKFFNRDDDFPPIEFTEENSDTPIKGFDPDTVDPQVAQQINLIDQIVDAMIQNKVDGNGKPINSDDQNTNGRHIA